MFLVVGLILAVALVAAPTFAAQDQPTKDQQPTSKTFGTAGQGAGDRQDNVFGTVDENMQLGRDPQTGDNVIRVQPKPKPKQDYELPPITVEPQINLPARQGGGD